MIRGPKSRRIDNHVAPFSEPPQVCRGALPLWTRCHERCRDAATLPELIKRRRWKFLLFRAACFIEIARKKHYTEEDEKRIVVFLIEEELGVRPQEPIFDDVGYRDRALKLALRDLSEATRDGLTVPKLSGGVGSLQSLCVDQLCTQTRDVLGLLREADPKVAGPVLLHRPELELETLLERRAVYFFRGLTWRSLGQVREVSALVAVDRVRFGQGGIHCRILAAKIVVLFPSRCRIVEFVLFEEATSVRCRRLPPAFFIESARLQFEH